MWTVAVVLATKTWSQVQGGQFEGIKVGGTEVDAVGSKDPSPIDHSDDWASSEIYFTWWDDSFVLFFLLESIYNLQILLFSARNPK